MSPLHKALYRDFFKSELDEQQERIINAELARCLIYIFWLNSALLILKTAHDRLEGVFMSGMAAILFLNLIFISVFIFTNSASRITKAKARHHSAKPGATLGIPSKMGRITGCLFCSHHICALFQQPGICHISAA